MKQIRLTAILLGVFALLGCPLPWQFTPSDTTGTVSLSNDPANPAITAAPSFVVTEQTSRSQNVVPGGSGTVTRNVNIEIGFTTETPGASYFYTTNGSDPEPGQPDTMRATSGAPVVLDDHAETRTLRVLAIGPGMYPSLVADASFQVLYEQAATPTFLPTPNRSYDADFEVTIQSATADAEIWYRIVDGIGGAPAPIPNDGISIRYDPADKPTISGSPTSKSISAIAVRGELRDSVVADAWYAIGYPGADSPVFSLGASQTFTTDQALTISVPPSEASDPSARVFVLDVDTLGGAPIPEYPDDRWVRFDDIAGDSNFDLTPDIAITGDGTVYNVAAITVVDGKEPSPAVQRSYTINYPTLVVSISPGGGPGAPFSATNGSFDSPVPIVISVTDPVSGAAVPGARVSFTTDGTTPAAADGGDPLAPITVGLDSPGVVMATASAPGYAAPGAPAMATYYGRIGPPSISATNEFSPQRLFVRADTTLAMSAPLAGSSIRYSTSTTGTPVNPSGGAVYVAPVNVVSSDVEFRVRAIAHPPVGSSYLVASNESSATYTVHPTFNVAASSDAALRAEIANAINAGATSTFDPVVKLRETGSEQVVLTQQLIINRDLILLGAPSNPELSTISGNNSVRHLVIRDDANVLIRGVRFLNGRAVGEAGESRGGGGGGGGAGAGGSIFVTSDGTVVTIESSRFESNVALGGTGGFETGGGDGGRGGRGDPQQPYSGAPGAGGLDGNLFEDGDNGQGGGYLAGGGGGGGTNGLVNRAGNGGPGGFGGGGGGGAESLANGNDGDGGNAGGPYSGRGGNRGGGGGGAGLGGAIFVQSGRLVVSSTEFVDNQAAGGGAGLRAQFGFGVGGNIYLASGSSFDESGNVFGLWSDDINGGSGIQDDR